MGRLKPETLEKDLDKYSESAKMQRGGRMGLPEFAGYLGVPVSDALEDLFSLFDEVGPSPGSGFLAKSRAFRRVLFSSEASSGDLGSREGKQPHPDQLALSLGCFLPCF